MKRSEFIKSARHKEIMRKMRAASSSPEARAKAIVTWKARRAAENKDPASHLRTPEVRAKATATRAKTMAARNAILKKAMHTNGQIPDATIDTTLGSVLTILFHAAAHAGVSFEDLARRVGERLADPSGR